MSKPHTLPAGLAYHCADCQLVVPADAPRPPHADAANCKWVRQHKLSWFNPAETLAGQHVMAVATHFLIYRSHLEGDGPHPATHDYHRAYRKARKPHFTSSATFKALTPEQIAAQSTHRRDGWLYR